MALMNRREGLSLLAMGGLATAASAKVDAKIQDMVPVTSSKEVEAEALKHFEKVHEGKGTLGVAFFRFGGAPAPAAFLIYDIPPGGSEGVHVHHLGDEKLGSFDEYYYIVSGEGQMEIDGKIVPVKAGDHVHTPLDVHHGIENSSAEGNLKVFLTYIKR